MGNKGIIHNRLIYADEFMLVANKPPNIPVHQTKDPNRENFTDIIKAELKLSYIRTANRIDLETSGLVVLGINPDFNKKLDSILESSEKKYLCIVHGITPEFFKIESFLKEEKEKMISVRSGGKKAITEFKRLGVSPSKTESLIEATLITGRRHQIRIHLFEKGYPIMGEKVYTNYKKSINSRCLLHSFSLEFINYKNEKVLAKAPIPDDFPNWIKIIPS